MNIFEEYEALKSDRGNWENQWQDIAELMICLLYTSDAADE